MQKKSKITLKPSAEIPFESEAHPEPMAQWEVDLMTLSNELHGHHRDEHPESSVRVDEDDYKQAPWVWDDFTGSIDDEGIISQNVSDGNPALREMPSPLTQAAGEKSVGKKIDIERSLAQKSLDAVNKENVSSDEEILIDPAVESWLEEHATYNDELDEYTELSVDKDDAFMRERADDIVVAMIEKKKKQDNLFGDLDSLLSEAKVMGPLSPALADTMIAEGMYLTLLERPDLFPGLAYDENLLMKFSDARMLFKVTRMPNAQDLFPNVNWQSLIDEIMNHGDMYEAIQAIQEGGDNFPAELSLDQLSMVMTEDYMAAFNYLHSKRGNALMQRYSALTILDTLCINRSVNYFISTGLVDRLTERETLELASRSSDNVKSLLTYCNKIHVFKSEDFMKRFLNENPNAYVGSIKCGAYSKEFQSEVFDIIKDSFVSNSTISDRILTTHQFTRLDDYSHRFLIDHCQAALATLPHIEVARRIFEKTGASDAMLQKFDDKYTEIFEERTALRKAVHDSNLARINRRSAEQSYMEAKNITLLTADRDAVLSPESLAEFFDYDHVVKIALRLQEQLGDQTRTNMIRCRSQYGGSIEETEAEMLSGFDSIMQQAIELLGDDDSRTAFEMKSLYENITFIGEKEYKEAVQAIAQYWKHALDKDPELKLLVHAGISEGRVVKSDQYMLDRILEYFSDEELEKYAGRLVTHITQVQTDDPSHVRVVLLDDWTISGAQLRKSASDFIYQNPQFEKCVEVQLIAASKERVMVGIEDVSYLKTDSSLMSEEVPVPVRAYYLAHDAPVMREDIARGAHITGAHSSVDYGFDTLLSNHRSYLRREYAGQHHFLEHVPLSHIVRVYRDGEYQLENIKRFRKIMSDKRRADNQSASSQEQVAES